MHPVEHAYHHKLPVWYQGKKDKVLGLGTGVCTLLSQGCLTWIPWGEVETEDQFRERELRDFQDMMESIPLNEKDSGRLCKFCEGDKD